MAVNKRGPLSGATIGDSFLEGAEAGFGIGVVTLLLAYEHSIISPRDLRRMNAAFFTLNGVISVVFFLSVAADVLIHR